MLPVVQSSWTCRLVLSRGIWQKTNIGSTTTSPEGIDMADELNRQKQQVSVPVQFLPTEAEALVPKEQGIALCLSGGGYRAMLFHTGALIRLNELGYLPKIDRVSSVSG